MKISSNTGSYSCFPLEEYAACLSSCFAAETGNEIWCAPEEEEYPCLAILVSGGQYEIAGYQVIPSALAMDCALSFFRVPKRPGCIEWEEL